MENIQSNIIGFLEIRDGVTKEILVSKHNAIHYENVSIAIANAMSNRGTGYISEMHFGNGGTSVDTTGVITYLPTNNTGSNASLYNPTYYKTVDDTSVLNIDPARNKMEVRHTTGQVYSDILISVILDYGEPAGQEAFDNTSNLDEEFVFDELGLKSWEGTSGTGNLLTHVIFHPVQKSLNRIIEIDYTVRFYTLTNLSSVI